MLKKKTSTKITQKTFNHFEHRYRRQYSSQIISGIDEAGRGPLAGPVVAACAAITYSELNYLKKIGVRDSKQLSRIRRQEIFASLPAQIKFGVGIVDAATIDSINILEATKLAMLQAYQDLKQKISYENYPEIVLVDGNFIPFAKMDKIAEMVSIVKGDQLSLVIGLASIIAKETRDSIMDGLHQKYPNFGWEKNFGYPTKLHIERLSQHGITEFHRKSFAPVKKFCS